MKNFYGTSMKTGTVLSFVAAMLCGARLLADSSIDEFPRLEGESDDAPRFQRAVDATPCGVLSVPAGNYMIGSPIVVTNLCSLSMNKSATLRAVSEMDFVLCVDNSLARTKLPRTDERRSDMGRFVIGGRIDGDGLAGCMSLDGFGHFTLRDTTFLNGRMYGLALNLQGRNCNEAIADNLYFKCTKSGLAGNVGLYIASTDGHFTDCIVVDYTVGIHIAKGGSNRLTRCHVWGGMVPPARKGEICEMLKDSICFKIEGSSSILRDCYADTGMTGFDIAAHDTRLLGCTYFSNKRFGLEDITMIRHTTGRLVVSEGHFIRAASPDAKVRVYEGCGKVVWSNMMYSGFGPDDETPGAARFGELAP